MKRRIHLTIAIAMLAVAGFAGNGKIEVNNSLPIQPQLEGFAYGDAVAPDGEEWQSPERLGYNKLQPRAWFASFATVAEARHVLPEYSSRRISLDGTWKFHFAKTPDERPRDFFLEGYDVSTWDDISVPSNWNLAGLQKDGTQKYGKPIYVNQPVIFYHRVKKDDWREGIMREPPTNWTTYEYRNEVGSYRRTFTVPEEWSGKELFVEFDGVDSFFYLWVNGRYVGFSKNSRDAARFDITRFARAGENQISVEVYRNSDGSFLEAQDMFRLPGIFRSVSVYATPKVHISDLRVETSFVDGEWELAYTASVEDLAGKKVKGMEFRAYLYENKLYSEETRGESVLSDSIYWNFKKKTPIRNMSYICGSGTVADVKPWTAEEPNLYTLVVELTDEKGRTTEAVSTQVGFRTVEIKDTQADDDEFHLAGRYFYVNGKTVKLKGVNRHETNPERGHAITRGQMEEEVMMMKRANINHVRTSHYSNDPYFYYLCNRYGIYLEAEANLESHEYYYGEASLSHPVEWRAAHVARMMELARARVNDPSIVIWSLGNEAGPGDNFKASYAALKEFDTSRPVQYERNNDIVDMGSNQYPSVNWVRRAVEGKMEIKYPFHISEYAHSMGNAVGNLQDYWDAIESTNFFCGGAIWDWIDQSLYNYQGVKESRSQGVQEKYLAYGGDFGDMPNDGQFVMNGIIFGDMEPKPQYYEVKKVYQNIGIKWSDEGHAALDIFNKNYYQDDLSGYDCCYKVLADGETVSQGTIDVGSVMPRSHKVVEIPGLNPDKIADGREYFLNVEFRLKHDMPWAKAGYPQATEQLLLKEARREQAAEVSGTVDINTRGECLEASGDGFKVTFDTGDGSIRQINYGGKDMLKDGGGPRLNAFRAWVNNDNWAYQNWYANGLHNLKHKATGFTTVKNADGSVSIVFSVTSQAPYGAKLEGGDRNWKRLTELHEKPFGKGDFAFSQNLVYTVYPDGSVALQTAITSNYPGLVLPRLGYALRLPKGMDNLSYYGRGPVDNYPDRKSSQHIGIYNNKVSAEFENFPKPQDMGNHQDTRWCSLTGEDGRGLLFVADGAMSFSTLPWSAQELAMANHPHELPASETVHLNLDMAITGLGGNSCGQGPPLQHDQVKATPHRFGFVICPIDATRNLKPETRNLSDRLTASPAPLLISRSKEGYVSIEAKNADGGNAVFYVTIPADGNRKRAFASRAQRYREPFLMADGGTVAACEVHMSRVRQVEKRGIGSEIVFEQMFPVVENVPVSIAFASSVESGEGDAEHLIDGDPNTYWHTMYSVTVANFPHWIDFDCGAVKTLKGFTYLPRQNSYNGNIKEYRIQVSLDGQAWSDPVAEGSFGYDLREKRVLFQKPVMARYLRFTALSANDGQDYATGAEFEVLQE